MSGLTTTDLISGLLTFGSSDHLLGEYYYLRKGYQIKYPEISARCC
jgi:hypothetical protein